MHVRCSTFKLEIHDHVHPLVLVTVYDLQGGGFFCAFMHSLSELETDEINVHTMNGSDVLYTIEARDKQLKKKVRKQKFGMILNPRQAMLSYLQNYSFFKQTIEAFFVTDGV
jgi:hypothetical protein